MDFVRLLADDLTGALDTAVQFAAPGRCVPVFEAVRAPLALPARFALSLGSRERPLRFHEQSLSRWAGLLVEPGATVFVKLDSLLRGEPAGQLSIVHRICRPKRCIVAPAFPFQGRVTRGGLQYVKSLDGWSRTGEDMGAALEALGIAVRRCKPGEPVPPGVSLWDAQSNEELEQIVSAASGPGEQPLWAGTAALAAALARSNVPKVRTLSRPVLGVFGTDHPVTAAQLAACGEAVLRIDARDPHAGRQAARQLDGAGLALVHLQMPEGTPRQSAAEHIAVAIGSIAREVRTPTSLVASGGETLRALCEALGTEHLEAIGEALPGVPVSQFCGGRWDGVRVFSKSGAFGSEALLRWLLSPQSF